MRKVYFTGTLTYLLLPTQVLLQKKKGKYKDSYQCQKREIKNIYRWIQFLLFQTLSTLRCHGQRGILMQRILYNTTTYIKWRGGQAPRGLGSTHKTGGLGRGGLQTEEPIVVDWGELHYISWLNGSSCLWLCWECWKVTSEKSAGQKGNLSSSPGPAAFLGKSQKLLCSYCL